MPWPWKVALGCDRPAPSAHDTFDGEDLLRCPFLLIEPWTLDIMHLYRLYGKGTLPAEGGVLEQDALIMDALHVIHGWVAEREEIERKEAEREARRREQEGR